MIKKRILFNFTIIIIFFVGIALLLYPYISQILFDIKKENIIEEYTKRLEQIPISDVEKLYHEMVQYNQKLYETNQKDLKDPFSYEHVDFNLKQFGFSEEIIGYIDIPSINLVLPIYLGASKENMKKGAVHLTQTSIPIGGQNTNSVIAAHRAYSKATMFKNIAKIQINDYVSITNFKETLTYKVTETKIIQPNEIEQILIQPSKDMITLISCHPHRKDIQRYVVYGEREHEETEKF